MARMKSPKYPTYPLSTAIDNIRRVYQADRTTPLPREVIAKHLGYSGISGASDRKIATLVQYGLLERTGKAEMKVSRLAVDILLPEDDEQEQVAIDTAALKPPLFAEIWNYFDKRVPSDEALRTYLLRRQFHDRAIDPVMKSFAPTIAMMKQPKDIESGGFVVENDESSALAPADDVDDSAGVSASIGDFVQWESQGVLQFKTPQRVRWVSDDSQWLAVEGNATGIPMNEVTIEQPPAEKRPPAVPPLPAIEQGSPGFTEWFRAKVGPDKLVTIYYKGSDDIGPREIEKMIAILQAQKVALED